ncbi:sensor histidine kinase [Populibacterium corticicola]|uniref:histidine kinase n=1 Tax=Populibacterium corticicola TaxID=1812826 RepID=A0ABW5XIW6_9MICO
MRLSTKLSLLIMSVLFAGLLIASVLTATLLQSSLIKQVDDDLWNTYSSIALRVLVEGTQSETDQADSDYLLPSDYYMAFRTTTPNKIHPWYTPDTNAEHGTPDLTQYIPSDLQGYEDDVFRSPFTTISFNGHTQWRVLVREVTDRRYPDRNGYVYIALPLTESRMLIHQIQRALLISAMFITATGGVVGLVAVIRSLRPLTRIEQTAAEIANGDLTQRVPQSPRGTEIGSLAQSLNSMLTQLEAAFVERERSEQRMRRFVSDASHELRTPLATIRGYGELYRMGALESQDALDDTMRRIEDSATRMATLVDDLLHLARLDEGRELRREHVDLAVLALDATSDLHALDPSRSVRLVECEVPTTATEVIGDEDRLRQVFANLVGNISRHTPQGTPVEVALGSIADDTGRSMVVVEFRDHGPGVDPDHVERIFERFYRVDSSRNRKSGGSGLGLAIVAAIIHAHDGLISVDETPGGGLTVRVVLPAAPPQPEDS